MDEQFQNPNIQQPDISPQPSHNIWLWVSVVLLAIIILGGAFWYFNFGNYVSRPPIPAPTESPSSIIDENNIVTFDDCAKAGNPIMESFPEQCRTDGSDLFVNWRGAGQFCIQVITTATNQKTGEIRDFPTPCDVPEGWDAN